jgi:hypothetical protein
MATYYVTTSGNDSNAGTSEGAAFASPGKATGVAVNGDIIYVKDGTYTLTTSSNNVSGGRCTLATGVKMEGYLTTIGDQAAKPVIHAGSITGISIVTLTASFNARPPSAICIECNGNSGTGNNGFMGSIYTINVLNCLARNCPGVGFTSSASSSNNIQNAKALSCGTGFSNLKSASYCFAKSCTGTGFLNCESLDFCISKSNNKGFDFGGILGWSANGCIAHGNTLDGFLATYDIGSIINSIATNNGAYGISIGASGGNKGLTLVNFAHRSNTSGSIQGTMVNAINTIALSADPFVDATNDDFNINNTAGGGADLRAVTLVLL